MYSFIKKLPTIEDIKTFKMEENINENFINRWWKTPTVAEMTL